MSHTSPVKRQTLPGAAELTERILYRLSVDAQARALAEGLLTKFRSVVGDLPASAEHHHSEAIRLYRHSPGVALHGAWGSKFRAHRCPCVPQKRLVYFQPAKILDSDLVAVIRQITDHYINTQQGKPVHAVKAQLGNKGHVLEEAVSFVRSNLKIAIAAGP